MVRRTQFVAMLIVVLGIIGVLVGGSFHRSGGPEE